MDNQLEEETQSLPNPSIITSQDLPTTNRSLKPSNPAWSVFLILLVCPPAGWYLMYKDKRFHSWFAYLLWFSALIPILIYAVEAVFILPKLITLYESLNVPFPATNIYISLAVLSLISISEIIIGFILSKKTRERDTSYKKILNTAIIVLFLNLLFGGYAIAYPILSIITPIYNLTNKINK